MIGYTEAYNSASAAYSSNPAQDSNSAQDSHSPLLKRCSRICAAIGLILRIAILAIALLMLIVASVLLRLPDFHLLLAGASLTVAGLSLLVVGGITFCLCEKIKCMSRKNLCGDSSSYSQEPFKGFMNSDSSDSFDSSSTFENPNAPASECKIPFTYVWGGETAAKQTLGLDEEANWEEIRTAYRTKAIQYHPDKNSHPDAHNNPSGLTQAGAAEKFKEIGRAYSYLEKSHQTAD